MATIIAGSHDPLVDKLKGILDAYEMENPDAHGAVRRTDQGPVWIRIVQDRFATWSKSQRHDYAWNYISDRLTDDELQDISVLLLLSPKEQKSSPYSEFEPVKSSAE